MSTYDKLKRTSGFTLIELLVVIAIIGILSSVVLASLNGARESSRDARRTTDLSQIQTSLSLYANENDGQYPSATTSLVDDGYMSVWPEDPGGGAYDYASDGSDYCVAALMEATSSVPDNDTDCAGGGSKYYTLGDYNTTLTPTN